MNYWLVIVFVSTFGSTGNQASGPIGPYFSQKACEAAGDVVTKAYADGDYGIRYACVQQPIEGD